MIDNLVLIVVAIVTVLLGIICGVFAGLGTAYELVEEKRMEGDHECES